MSKQTELYRYYSDSGVLLYVGISYSSVARASQHRSNSHWYKLFTTLKTQRFDTRVEALAAEEAAIKTEFPLFNGTHNSGGIIGDIQKVCSQEGYFILSSSTIDRAFKGYKNIKKVLSVLADCGYIECLGDDYYKLSGEFVEIPLIDETPPQFEYKTDRELYREGRRDAGRGYLQDPRYKESEQYKLGYKSNMKAYNELMETYNQFNL